MKYLILQNTMAPYRVSLFNKLYEMGMDFEVLYMCEIEKGRSWKIDKAKIKYKYTIVDGYKGHFGIPLYWCPSFIYRFIKDVDVKIILGGAWCFIDVIITCILKRICVIKNEVLFWTEANYQTIGARKKNKIRDIVRHFVYNTGEGHIIVSGQMAIKSFKIWQLRNKTFHLLPNVIDESIFLKSNNYHSFDINGTPTFVMSVRFIEHIKGVINFFQAIGLDNIKKCKFLLAGDGPDKEKTYDWLIKHDCIDNVEFLGFCTPSELVDIYLKSDVMILPSFSDQSPLVLVEGICCGLPLLVSERCGNHYETVIENENGFLFDPSNHSSIKNAFEKMMSNRYRWNEMSKVSYNLYNNNFKQEKVLREFMNSLNY